MPEIRLAHFVTSFEMGGVRSLVEHLASNLPKDKFNVFVCSLIGENYGSLNSNRYNLQNYSFRLNGVNKIYGIPKIINFLKANRIHIVHTHPGLISRFAAILAKVPVIISTWHGSPSKVRLTMPIIDQYLARHTTMFVANSFFTRIVNNALVAIPERRSRVIYNGIDLERFGFRDAEQGRQKRSEWGIPLEAMVISATGRLHPDKGHDVLVAAAEKVVKSEPRAYFVVAGDGECRKMLEARVSEMGISNKVRFIGAMDDVRPLLWASNLFVQPSSRREGFGLSLVEAMATGLPVVGTDLGGIPEIINAELNGLVAPPGNSSQLASQIMRLIKDAELSTRLSLNAQLTIIEKFDAKRMVSQYSNLYQELLH